MKIMAKIPLWALALALVPLAVPAFADEPFDVENGHWMSFDYYKDAAKRGTLDSIKDRAPAPAQPATSDMPPSGLAEASALDGTPGTAPDGSAEVETNLDQSVAPQNAQTQTSQTQTDKSGIALPKRPVALPLMPGFNKGFEIKVTSTEDDNQISARPSVDGTDNINLSDKRWQNPSAPKRNVPTIKNGDGDDIVPLDVRLSMLPNSKITPIPSPEKKVTAQQLARQAIEKGLAKTKPQNQTEQEAQACAAIDAYRKQQLDAIQGDRQTLKALQEAVAALGLQKQLGFMTGNDGTLNTSIQGQKGGQSLPTVR